MPVTDGTARTGWVTERGTRGRASDGLGAMEDLAMSDADANRNGVDVRPGVDEREVQCCVLPVKGVGCVQETQTPAGAVVIGRA